MHGRYERQFTPVLAEASGAQGLHAIVRGALLGLLVNFVTSSAPRRPGPFCEMASSSVRCFKASSFQSCIDPLQNQLPHFGKLNVGAVEQLYSAVPLLAVPAVER